MWNLQGFGSQLLIGTAATVQLAACALAVGTAFGLVGAALQFSGWKLLRAVGYAYAAIVRGVPDLLIVFMVYFGGTVTLGAIAGRYVDVNAFAAGTFALALSFGAFASEVFRGAIEAVPRGQVEAAKALGFSGPKALFAVIAPQALRIALPPYGNQAIILLKQTSLVSIIGCDELMRKAAEASGATREPFTMYLAAAAIYLLLTSVSTLLLELSEHRLARHART